MRLQAINNSFDYKPAFGINIEKDKEFYLFRRLLYGFSPEKTDEFVSSIEESEIGGDKNAIKMEFFPMAINKDGYPVIRYSFWKNGHVKPKMAYQMAEIDGFQNTLKEILNDCKRFYRGDYDAHIAKCNAIARSSRGKLPAGTNIIIVDNSDNRSIF